MGFSCRVEGVQYNVQPQPETQSYEITAITSKTCEQLEKLSYGSAVEIIDQKTNEVYKATVSRNNPCKNSLGNTHYQVVCKLDAFTFSLPGLDCKVEREEGEDHQYAITVQSDHPSQILDELKIRGSIALTDQKTKKVYQAEIRNIHSFTNQANGKTHYKIVCQLGTIDRLFLNAKESFSDFMIAADRVFDYIPLASTCTNLYNLFMKHIYIPIAERCGYDVDGSERLVYIREKDDDRVFFGLFPIAGNIINAINDRHERHVRRLFG